MSRPIRKSLQVYKVQPTADQVRRLLSDYRDGVPAGVLALRIGVSKGHMQRILREAAP